jgi:hypothetical protein
VAAVIAGDTARRAPNRLRDLAVAAVATITAEAEAAAIRVAEAAVATRAVEAADIAPATGNVA